MVKHALLSLVFLLSAALLLKPGLVSAVSSDDFTGNYARRDPEDYNFLPLVLDPGSSTGATGAPRDIISHNMVYDQGYEVQCAKPDWNITPQVYGAIEEYFELYSAPVTLGSDASYNVDFTTGKIPLFRGDEELLDTQKNSSFEGYFGANYLKDVPPEINSSGVANVLMTAAGQCVAKYGNLSSLFGDGGLCSKLQDPGQCVLNREIQGTAFTTESLYDSLTALFALTNGERNFSCEDIAGGWTEDLAEFGFSFQEYQNEVKPVGDALLIMPLNLDILYRLAFLVISPQQNPDTGSSDVFQFLQNQAPEPNPVSHAPINEDKHALIVIGFKVPFLATNSLFSLPNLRDSALLSAYAMRNIESLQREEEQMKTDRELAIQAIIENKETKPVINCDGMPQCSGGGDSQVLFQALIDIINGSEQACGSFKGPYENAGDLGSAATASAEKAYDEPYFSEVLPIKNSAGFTWQLEVRDEDVTSDLNQEKVAVSAHLVTPYGTNLSYVAQTLQSFFAADEFAKMVENNCIEDFNGECGMIPEYFTFGGITADLDSGSDSFSFIYDSDPDCLALEDPEARANCQELSFGATATEQPREPIRILGAKVGWLIQKIQENIRGIGSKAYEYIRECKRTEDLFLGRCLGFLGKPGGSDSEAVNSCNDYAGIQVDLPANRTDYGKIVCSVAHNNPMDVQLLWGLSQIEGHIMNNFIDAGEKSVACSELIVSDCGSSVIGPGLIVPQCVNVAGCPAVAWAVDDGEAAQKYRESLTPDVVCSVEGTLKYMLALRKSQIGELKALYRAAHGTDPDAKQLYYMMAGKNNGTLTNEQLVSPACGNAEGIDPAGIGCSGDNYCVCAMDRFTYQCGQSV